MLARKRAAMALLAASLLTLGACNADENPEDVGDPSGDVEQGPGEEVPDAEATDDSEDN